MSVQLLLVLTSSIDFVMAFSLSDLNVDVAIELLYFYEAFDSSI